MKRFFSWFASSLGYLLYTVAVVSVLLWWFFPAESARVWLEDRLNTEVPAVKWKVKGLALGWPLRLTVSDVRLLNKESEDEQVFRIDRVVLFPDFTKLHEIGKQVPLAYEAGLLGGTIRGKMTLIEAENRLQGKGSAENVELSSLEPLWTKLNRNVTGRITAHFSHDLVWPDFNRGVVEADLRVDEGSVSLQQPVFNLTQFDFSSMSASLQLKDDVVTLASGKAVSKMLSAEYEGSVALQSPLSFSQIKLNGFLEPRPELLGRLQNNATIALIKNQLQENKLLFSITGTLMEPGIVFQGASGLIDGIIQGSGQ